MNHTIQPIASLIIPVKNEGEFIRTTIESALKVKNSSTFEIIVVDDGSTDGCCDFLSNYKTDTPINLIKSQGIGAAMARNLGADHSCGKYLIFCDAHLFFQDRWIDRLLEPIKTGTTDAVNPGIADSENPKNIGYGFSWSEQLEPTWNAKMRVPFFTPLLAGGCLAMSREAFYGVGGFDRGFRTWGREDEEISLKLWLFGYQCYVEPAVNIRHVFRNNRVPFPITWEEVNYNLLRMAYSHFNEERIEKCKKLMKHSNPSVIDKLVLSSGVLEQRRIYFMKRKYDDDWFMNKFSIFF